jgi:aspartate/methionine/tyrosine aminotransferase
MRPDLAAQVSKLMVNSNSCTASFSQIAGIEALQGDQSAVDEMLVAFDHRRKKIVAWLNEIPGVSCHLPKGAFYVMPSIKELGIPAKELQEKILFEGGVSCLAGTAFGAEGEGFLRFSYANSTANIERGLQRVRKVIESL